MERPSVRTVAAVPALLVLTAGLAIASAAAEEPMRGRLPGPLIDHPASYEIEMPPAKGAGPSLEVQVVELVNQERWSNGQLPPLKAVTLLDAAAALHSGNMASRNFFAHCDPDTGTQPWDRMTAAGYFWNAAAENIAAGSTTALAVVNLWMGSPGHRANILSTSYYEVGTGYAFEAGDSGNVRQDQNGDCIPDTFNTGPYFRYWTQVFGRRSSVLPLVIEREAHATAVLAVDLFLYGSGWAVDMRLRNENGSFTPWQPFSTDVAWTLSTGGGLKTVTAEIRNGVGTVRSASDSILLLGAGVPIFEDGFESGTLSAWTSTAP